MTTSSSDAIAYDPDDIDEQQINITLGRIANSYRTKRSKAVKK